MVADTAAYRYTNDQGLNFQVLLPTDFATALGETLAVGNEPYLPSYVSPRYATYQSTTPIAWRSAVITTPSLFASPPQFLTVGGNNYAYKSGAGESIPPSLGGSLMVIAGPQGPAGPAATIAYGQKALGIDASLVASTDTQILKWDNLPIGFYRFYGSALILCGGTAGNVVAHISPLSGATYVNTATSSAASIVAAKDFPLFIENIMQLTNATNTVALYCEANIAMTCKATDPIVSAAPTYFGYTKLA